VGGGCERTEARCEAVNARSPLSAVFYTKRTVGLTYIIYVSSPAESSRDSGVHPCAAVSACSTKYMREPS